MSISSNIEFFTSELAANTPGIGTIMTMFANSEGALGIGGLVTFAADAAEVFLLRGPQIKEADLTEDRLSNITSYTISTITSIDLTATGTTTVYTAPADQTALIIGIIFQATATDTVTVVPQVSAGLNPSTDNVFAIESLVGFDAVDDLFVFWAKLNKAVVVADGGVLDLDVSVAATATNLIATARVIGIVV